MAKKMKAINLEQNESTKIFVDNQVSIAISNNPVFHGVTPQTRGSVDYPSTRGIRVNVGLPNATSENRAVSFVRRTLPKYSTCIYLSQTMQYIHHMIHTWIKMASWAHKPILVNIPTISPIVTRVNMFFTLIQHIY